MVELIFESLGLTGLLLSLPRDRLEAFVARFLGPIIDRDDLVTTLAVWYKAKGSRAAVASRLNLHRNSVGYRIARIKQKLGLDPLDPWVAPQLQAALACREVLTALADLAEGGALNGETRESEH
jgi:DNA-binding PucR family transcriptional regulator